jgi:muconate cycloisomerase
VADDVKHVLAIKRALGDRASVRVDVNQAWSELEAVRGIAALQDGGIDLIEQPVKAVNVAALRRLKERFDVAIMADEALHGPDDAMAIARADAADVYAVKITQSGGLMPALEVATVARLNGIGLYGGTMLEGGIGTAATAQVCATFAELAWGTELFGPLLLTQEVLREPLVYRDFELVVPTGPGLGVEVDTDKLRSMQRK